MSELDLITLSDFNLLMKAYNLKRIDSTRDFLEREFLKRAINATEERKDGKVYYVYTDVKDLYDYEKEERKVLGLESEEDKEDDKFDRLRLIAKRVKELRKRGGINGL